MASSEISDRSQRSAETKTPDGRSVEGISSTFVGFTRIFFTTIALLSTGPLESTAQKSEPPPLKELITNLQFKYDSVRDFSADFEHRYAGGVLRTTLIEHGSVHVKKPGMMRWNYTVPEEKIFVSDGITLYSYIPLDRQVFVGKIPQEDRASTPALFLTGKGNLSRDFIATYDKTGKAPASSWVIRLTPRVLDGDYEWLTLTVDNATLSIIQLSASDFQGGTSTFTFTDLKENQGLTDELFKFDIPLDAEIVTAERF